MRRKLKSQAGASMLIALVFFFLCVTVGIIVLTAAASNSGQLSHVKEQRQAYLATSSAARLIREEIAQTSVYFKRVDTEVTCNCGEKDSFQTDYTYPGDDAASTLSGHLSTMLKNFCQASNWENQETASKETITIVADGLPDVSASFATDTDLNIQVQLNIADNGAVDHPLTLVLKHNEDGPKSHKDRSKDHSISTEEGDQLCTITTTTTITTITWTGDIGKGAVT